MPVSIPRFVTVLATVLVAGLCWWAILAGVTAGVRAATREEMRVIEMVNQAVNGSIRYMTDLEQYGESDRWVADPPSMRGDCEDYALTKLRRLTGQGFAASRLVVARVTTETGEAHAVLVVDDDLVLDNRFAWTQSRAGLVAYGYRFAGALR